LVGIAGGEGRDEDFGLKEGRVGQVGWGEDRDAGDLGLRREDLAEGGSQLGGKLASNLVAEVAIDAKRLFPLEKPLDCVGLADRIVVT